jgi:hypothetical protein
MPSSMNGRVLPVQVSGTVSDSDTAATLNNSVDYAVFAGQSHHPLSMGTATLDSQGDYSLSINIPARGFRHNMIGHPYRVSVSASDNAGNTGTDSALVALPDQQGYPGGGTGSFSHRSGTRTGGGGGSAGLKFGGPGEGQQNSVSVPGSNDTTTQYITNSQSNTYNITTNVNNSVNNNTPPQPPPAPGPPPRPAPPGPAPAPSPAHGPVPPPASPPTPPPGPGPMPHPGHGGP